MNYMSPDLSKNNLAAEVADVIANLAHGAKLAFKKATKIEKKKTATVITDSADYYANAPRRNGGAVSIERELKAQGNAW